MFVPYRVPLKEHLGTDDSVEHTIQIIFPSTFLKGRSLQRENADKTPVAIRGGGSGGGAGTARLSHC